MYSSTEDKIEFSGLKYIVDMFQGESAPEDPYNVKHIIEKTNAENMKYRFVSVFGYKVKEMKLMCHL